MWREVGILEHYRYILCRHFLQKEKHLFLRNLHIVSLQVLFDTFEKQSDFFIKVYDIVFKQDGLCTRSHEHTLKFALIIDP